MTIHIDQTDASANGLVGLRGTARESGGARPEGQELQGWRGARARLGVGFMGGTQARVGSEIEPGMLTRYVNKKGRIMKATLMTVCFFALAGCMDAPGDEPATGVGDDVLLDKDMAGAAFAELAGQRLGSYQGYSVTLSGNDWQETGPSVWKSPSLGETRLSVSVDKGKGTANASLSCSITFANGPSSPFVGFSGAAGAAQVVCSGGCQQFTIAAQACTDYGCSPVYSASNWVCTTPWLFGVARSGTPGVGCYGAATVTPPGATGSSVFPCG